MAFLYELAVLGAPSNTQIYELEKIVFETVQRFGWNIGSEVAWNVLPAAFNPGPQSAAATVFFGGQNAPQANLQTLVQLGIPILPVVSNLANVPTEIPPMLQPLNCLAYNSNNNGEAQRITTALLECVGLLPYQRRVFVSYLRREARYEAVQLFEAFASRHFDVFLDTHGIAPAINVQSRLWHHLCGSDVLVMLDTTSYFKSQWTSAEFGRALAINIPVLRIGWPNTTRSPRTATAINFPLQSSDFNSPGPGLNNGALDRICSRLEAVRYKNYPVRHLNLVSKVEVGAQQAGGKVTGAGKNKAVYIDLANGTPIVVYPTLGIPDSTTLHDAITNASGQQAGVAYDPLSLELKVIEHLDWLSGYTRPNVRWVKAPDAASEFTNW